MELINNEYQPLRDLVYETLRQGILKGELTPGARLIEEELAADLGVSRTPVREAVHRLEQEGLVYTVPRRGAHVADISENNVHDVLEVRKTLEELAVSLAVERINPQEKIRLREAEIAFARASKGNDLREIARCDEAFHDVIYQATKNEKLEMLLNNLREQMYRFRYEYIKDERARSRLCDEHHEITEAVLRGYTEVGRHAIGLHIDNQKETILTNLQRDRERKKQEEEKKLARRARK